jgi:hypothetical protein
MNHNQARNNVLNANLSKNYTTHMGVLIKVLMNSTGDVIECGGGPFSTPLLHWLCKMQGRKLITYENHPDYFEFERHFQSMNHSVRRVEDWDKIKIPDHVGVVFIDHHPPERRMVETLRFKEVADFVVIHDSERVSLEYNRPEVYDQFKHRFDWKDCKPWTTVLSNKKDLTFMQ